MADLARPPGAADRTGGSPPGGPDAYAMARPGASAAPSRTGGTVRPRRRGRASATTVALWLLWTPLALWTLVRVCGLGTSFPLVQLLAFTPYAALACGALLGATLVARRWPVAVAAAVTCAALAVCLLPRAIVDPGTRTPAAGTGAAGGVPLRVLSVNLRIGGADPAAVVDLVRRHRVDLLAIQEYTADSGTALDAAGLDGVLAFRVAHPHGFALGSALYSRFQLRDEGLRVHGSGFTQARATVSVPGAAPLAVESVHPCAPGGPEADVCWTADLADQPPATVDGPVRLLLGDFNATLDHAPLRRLVARGYRDVADARGAGLMPTWPYDGKPVPGVTLDHVLADRRIGVTGYAVYPVPRTDHRAVYAELALPAGP